MALVQEVNERGCRDGIALEEIEAVHATSVRLTSKILTSVMRSAFEEKINSLFRNDVIVPSCEERLQKEEM